MPSRTTSRNSSRISATMRLAGFIRSISRGVFKLIIPCILTSARYNSSRRLEAHGRREARRQESFDGDSPYPVQGRRVFRTQKDPRSPRVRLSPLPRPQFGCATAPRADLCRPRRQSRIQRAEDFDALVICGGPSVPDLFWNDKKLAELAAAMSAAGKVVAAISLATVVLAKAKLLAGKQATVYFLPQAIQELKTGGRHLCHATRWSFRKS